MPESPSGTVPTRGSEFQVNSRVTLTGVPHSAQRGAKSLPLVRLRQDSPEGEGARQ
jgi:hypothetical protein